MRMIRARFALSTIALMAGTAVAGAQDVEGPPNVTPAELRISGYRYLPAAEHDLYVKAFAMAQKGDRKGAIALAHQGKEPIAERILQWSYVLDRNAGASFSEIDAFLKGNPDWPLRDTLYVRAENAIGPDMPASAVVAWFGNRTPASSLGRLKLGEALVATGNLARGRTEIQRAWTEGTFESKDEPGILKRDAQFLSPEVNEERLDNLLWRDDINGAKRQIDLVDAETKKLAQARIALKSGGTAATHALDNISGAQSSDPSLTFDRARAARRAGNNKQAQSLLQQIPVRNLPQRFASRWWGEVNLNARQALQDGDPRSAYGLVNDTGLTSGTEFADAEFFAGWLALRYVGDARAALAHFRKLDAGVSRPISKARARYWMARAYEALGDLGNSQAQYALAAEVSETFYGQLAQARIESAPVLHLSDTDIDVAPAKADFDRLELVRAMRLLADLGEEGTLRTFANRVAELYPQPRQQKLLLQLMVDLGYREVAVRLAKAASYNDLPMLEFTHPVIALPEYRGRGSAPEPALVMGLIRQETEFDPNAVSSAGARGVMQLMPSTARAAARTAGLAYRPNDLLTKPNYAIQLGTVELGGLLQDLSGSLVLAIAAYNAGPTNARKWVSLNGDPRSGKVDPIDWIEAVPFSETRNYIQRVLENMQVYRNRIAGKDQPLRILADLYYPSTPNGGVLSYSPADTPANVVIPRPKPE